MSRVTALTTPRSAPEPVEDLITDLHCLAKYCEFGVLKDLLIRDRIVVGL